MMVGRRRSRRTTSDTYGQQEQEIPRYRSHSSQQLQQQQQSHTRQSSSFPLPPPSHSSRAPPPASRSCFRLPLVGSKQRSAASPNKRTPSPKIHRNRTPSTADNSSHDDRLLLKGNNNSQSQNLAYAWSSQGTPSYEEPPQQQQSSAARGVDWESSSWPESWAQPVPSAASSASKQRPSRLVPPRASRPPPRTHQKLQNQQRRAALEHQQERQDRIAVDPRQPGRAQEPSAPTMESLLVPPAPVDRHPRTLRRQQQRQSKIPAPRKAAGLYEGELEPTGVRGQEARVETQQPPPQAAADLPGLRRDWHTTRPTGVVGVASSTTTTMNPPEQRPPRQSSRKVRDEVSTASSQSDLQQIEADFLQGGVAPLYQLSQTGQAVRLAPQEGGVASQPQTRRGRQQYADDQPAIRLPTREEVQEQPRSSRLGRQQYSDDEPAIRLPTREEVQEQQRSSEPQTRRGRQQYSDDQPAIRLPTRETVQDQQRSSQSRRSQQRHQPDDEPVFQEQQRSTQSRRSQRHQPDDEPAFLLPTRETVIREPQQRSSQPQSSRSQRHQPDDEAAFPLPTRETAIREPQQRSSRKQQGHRQEEGVSMLLPTREAVLQEKGQYYTQQQQHASQSQYEHATPLEHGTRSHPREQQEATSRGYDSRHPSTSDRVRQRQEAAYELDQALQEQLEPPPRRQQSQTRPSSVLDLLPTRETALRDLELQMTSPLQQSQQPQQRHVAHDLQSRQANFVPDAATMTRDYELHSERSYRATSELDHALETDTQQRPKQARQATLFELPTRETALQESDSKLPQPRHREGTYENPPSSTRGNADRKREAYARHSYPTDEFGASVSTAGDQLPPPPRDPAQRQREAYARHFYPTDELAASISTASDDDLGNMRGDLLPTLSSHGEAAVVQEPYGRARYPNHASSEPRSRDENEQRARTPEMLMQEESPDPHGPMRFAYAAHALSEPRQRNQEREEEESLTDMMMNPPEESHRQPEPRVRRNQDREEEESLTDMMMNAPEESHRQPERLRVEPPTSRSAPSLAAQKAAAAAAAVDSSPPGAAVPPNMDVERLNAAAVECVRNQEYDQALVAFERVLALQRQKHGPIHPSVASAHHNLGTVHARRAALLFEDSLQQRNVRAQALSSFQAAARTARDSLGPDHPNVAVSLVRIGFLLLQSRQYQHAVVTFQEALRIRLATYGAMHALVANLYNNLGVCQMHLGEFAVGKELLEQALLVQRQLVKESSSVKTLTPSQKVHQQSQVWKQQLELADTLFNVGGLCLEWIRRQGPDTRRAVQAEVAFEESLLIRRQVLGPTDPMVIQVEDYLEMAKATPRPKIAPDSPSRRPPSPGRREPSSPNRALPRSAPGSPSRGPPSPGRREPSSPVRPSSRSSRSSRSTTPVTPVEALSRSSTPAAVDNELEEPPLVPRLSATSGTRSSRQMPSDESDEPGNSIFRAASRPRSSSALTPPVLEVAVSKEEAEEQQQSGRNTRILLAPHWVPKTSTAVASSPPSYNTSDEVALGRSVLDDQDGFVPDTSDDFTGERGNSLQDQDLISPSTLQPTYSYDAEENCLLSDGGIDSEHGRVHFPLTWKKAGVEESRSRDILVTRPVRGANQRRDSGSVSTSTAFSTGNAERDAVMSRARAILEQHSPSPTRVSVESDQDETPDDETVPNQSSPNGVLDHDLLEDGIAPLGGSWPTGGEPVSVREMLDDPMNHLPEIHEEASIQLQNNNHVDAVHLFDAIHQCQRRRHGPVHQDVAAALHNLGIAQLRSGSHLEALKAFEEAARVRKGSLGKNHPQVAVSLVKVGITLLLLHRFEEALWSFREALSVRKHALGALHPSTARIYNNIGCVHVEFNEYREARRAFEAALDIQRNALCHDPDSGPLMFGTATTLCNLGYLYRYRDMHAKASLVLKEAVDLQESVLGRSHSTVLSTLDNLADSCGNSGNAADALKYYGMILERFRAGGNSDSMKLLRAESVLLYKMSRVHRQRNDRQSQLDTLKLALRSIRAYADTRGSVRADTLERRIQYDIRACREQIEKEQLKWV